MLNYLIRNTRTYLGSIRIFIYLLLSWYPYNISYCGSRYNVTHNNKMFTNLFPFVRKSNFGQTKFAYNIQIDFFTLPFMLTFHNQRILVNIYIFSTWKINTFENLKAAIKYRLKRIPGGTA